MSVSGNITRVSILASCNTSGTVSIEISNLVGTGEYLLYGGSNGITFTTDDGISTKDYSSYSTGKGKIIITKNDRANTILSGTFEFEGMDYDEPSKIIKVTSGRFDINYKR